MKIASEVQLSLGIFQRDKYYELILDMGSSRHKFNLQVDIGTKRFNALLMVLEMHLWYHIY